MNRDELELDATKGSVEAMLCLAFSWHHGLGGQRDLAVALKWYKHAAANGSMLASCAFSDLSNVDSVDARVNSFHAMKMAAQAGLISAQYRLGSMYQHGLGGGPDINSAMHWYKKAASEGHPLAAFRLALLLEDTAKIPANDLEAITLLRQAAAGGSGVAAFHLAAKYKNGTGVAPDYKLAMSWYERASALGYRQAHLMLALVFEKGLLGQVHDSEKAEYYLMLAEESNRKT